VKHVSSALATLALAVTGLAVGGAHAEEPQPWQVGLQPAASLSAERIDSFHALLLWIITLIALFVLSLLAYVVWRFRASKNPVPTRTSHNTLIEVLWTVVPIMILVIIAIPSFKLLYYVDKTHDAELTLKAIGPPSHCPLRVERCRRPSAKSSVPRSASIAGNAASGRNCAPSRSAVMRVL